MKENPDELRLVEADIYLQITAMDRRKIAPSHSVSKTLVGAKKS